MTDKEIIIDGVDICNCEFHSSTPSSELCYMKGNKCNNNINCYYKQLQRKIQECEELRKFKEQVLKPVILPMSNEPELINKVDRYKQALEKIEDVLDPTAVCEDCKENYYNQHCEECTTHEIVNIINEVKDGTI